jgi:hypothetical protein
MNNASCQIKNNSNFKNAFHRDPVGTILSLRGSVRATFDYVAATVFKFGTEPIAQRYIGYGVNLKRETVNRSIAQLVDIGVVTKVRRKDPERPWMDLPCIYGLSPLVTTGLLHKIKHFMPYIGKVLLFASIIYAQQKRVFDEITHKDKSISLSYRKEKEEYSFLLKNKTYMSKRETMKHTLSPAITNLPFNLTKDEQMQLSLFTDEAILHAFGVVYPLRETIGNVVEYMINLCVSFHDKGNIPLNEKNLAETIAALKGSSSSEPEIPKIPQQQDAGLAQYTNMAKKNTQSYRRPLVMEDPAEVKRKLDTIEVRKNYAKLGLEFSIPKFLI